MEQNNLKEIIIALSLNPQGEHTDMYLREILIPLKDKYNFNIVSFNEKTLNKSYLFYLLKSSYYTLPFFLLHFREAFLLS